MVFLKFRLLIIEYYNQSMQCRSATSKSLGALSLKNIRHLLTGRAICTFWYPVFSELDMYKGFISIPAFTICLSSSPSLHVGTTLYNRSNTPLTLRIPCNQSSFSDGHIDTLHSSPAG